MHLIRLLSVSDTFTAGEIPVGRYHVVGLKVLPRFHSAGMAVRAPVRPTRRWHGARSEAERSVPAGERMTAVPAGGQESQGMVTPAASRPVAQVGPPEEGPREAERPVWWKRGVVWLMERIERSRNPFRGSGLRVSKTVRPRQGTLSLEAVQVVCNDLKDSDFDLVPSEKKARLKGVSKKAVSVPCDFAGRPDDSAGPMRSGLGTH